jgi:AAA ATPase domain
MDPVRNPYQPSAGVRPRELAGRDRELTSMDVLIGRAERGYVSQSLVLTGLRGVGKTVLLNEFARRARDRGWIVAQIEGPSDFDATAGSDGALRAKLARGLHSSMREALGRWKKSPALARAAGALKSFTLSVDPSGTWTIGIDVDAARGRADTGQVELDLPELALDLGTAAQSRGVGVLVCVDEMQQLSHSDLAAICAACHESGQREVPFYVAGAGLPNLPGVLGDAKSYAERLFDYSRLDPLSAVDAARALSVPAEEQGVQWRKNALEHTVAASGAYPFFLQTFGRHIWDAAVGPSVITLDDARVGSLLAAEQLDRGFFQSRWDRATPYQRRYLTAMAVDGDGPASSGDVAGRLGRKLSALGPVRAELIAKGLIYAPEHGQVAFTTPGMAGFIERLP